MIYVCVCVCVCVGVGVGVGVVVCMCMHMHMPMYVCVCTYMHMAMYTHSMCMYIYIYITYECTTGKPTFLDGKQPRGGFIYRFSLSAPVTHGSHGQVNLSNAAGTRCYWPTDASTTGSMPPSTGSKELGRIWRFP